VRFKEFLTEAKEVATKIGLEFQMLLPLTDDEIKTSLRGMVDGDVRIHASDSAKKLSNGWNVYVDPTIGEHGIELASPKLDLFDALHTLSKICDWMDENSAKTTDSTSLKIAISIPNIGEKLDPVKLILFMDDRAETALAAHVNRYTAPQVEVIAQKIKATGRLPETLGDIERDAYKFLSIRSGGSNKMSMGILELRIAGGSGYEKSPSDLRKKTFKLVNAVEVACDPAAEKSEYLKKLTDLFSSSAEIAHVTKNDAHKIPEDLHRLYRFSAAINHAWKIFDKDQVHGDARHALIILINTALKTVKEFKTSLSLSEKTFFKHLARQVALQESDVDSYYNSDHIARLNFKKEIGV
jgi:hypothetical protein